MLLFIILIIVLILYYINQYFKSHYWYEFDKYTDKKFYVEKISNNVFTKSFLSELELDELVVLYKNYFPSINVSKEKIKNFLKIMPNSVNISIKENNCVIGSVFNSITPVHYDNNKYLVNFVDYALIKKGERYKGLFKKLINSIADYSNKQEANMVIFKVDLIPIRTYMNGYNFKSKFYYFERNDVKKYENYLVEKYEYIGNENDNLHKKYKLCAIVDKNIFTNNEERITLKCRDTIINFKINSDYNYEILYIINVNIENINNIISYLFKNYNLGVITVDDIGGNGIVKLIEGFKYNYDVYHYILGMKDKIKKNEFYFYY